MKELRKVIVQLRVEILKLLLVLSKRLRVITLVLLKNMKLNLINKKRKKNYLDMDITTTLFA